MPEDSDPAQGERHVRLSYASRKHPKTTTQCFSPMFSEIALTRVVLHSYLSDTSRGVFWWPTLILLAAGSNGPAKAHPSSSQECCQCISDCAHHIKVKTYWGSERFSNDLQRQLISKNYKSRSLSGFYSTRRVVSRWLK